MKSLIALVKVQATVPVHLPKVAIFLSFFLPILSFGQAVTGIITDYNGFWKTSASAVNPVKPNNSHNLLAFTYNGVQYSTGVNNDLLVSRGETFTTGDFWSLPVASISGTINSNTKAGLGALYDGVSNGPSNPAPEWGISTYLTDGIKGLNLGTCIANLPSGTMSFSIQNIAPSSIGDGIPDILVTQVADPTGNSFDRYEFTDAGNARVGNYKDIVFNNISAIGNWTADFYDVKNNPMTLTGGFTQTDRPLRLWAADLSELGITAANYTQIKHFVINLCGNSDLAFVAYNNRSVNFQSQSALPVQYSFFKGSLSAGKSMLSWQTVSEKDASHFIVERSQDGNSFRALDSVAARNGNGVNDYSYIDARPSAGSNYYRLKQVDNDGRFSYSSIVRLDPAAQSRPVARLYPNPAKDRLHIDHPAAAGRETIAVYSQSGILMQQQQPARSAVQTKIDIHTLKPGLYYLVFQNGEEKTVQNFLVN
ncbi:MAG TPA: T9SS type A sorting domain-containing protein [Flavisolibacter sp.]|nr:T9SS type A sorting domain-containing protein [Flavisolibacter sp.]